MKRYMLKETGTYRFDPPFEVLFDSSGSIDPFMEPVIARIEEPENELRVLGAGLDLEMAIRDISKKMNRLAESKRFAYRAFHK